MFDELEQAWNDPQAVPSYVERFAEEDACYLYRDLSEMLQIEDEEDQCWKQHEGAA